MHIDRRLLDGSDSGLETDALCHTFQGIEDFKQLVPGGPAECS